MSCNCFIRLQWHLGTSRRSSRSTGDKFFTSNVVNKSFSWVVYLRRNLPTTIWTCDGKCWNVLTKLHVGESLSENCYNIKIHSGQIGQKRNNPIQKPVFRFQMVSFTSQLNIFKELPIYRTGSLFCLLNKWWWNYDHSCRILTFTKAITKPTDLPN